MVLVLIVVDGTFFSITNPNKGSSVMLIVGFLLVAATMYFIFNRLFKFISLYGFSKENGYRRFAFYFTGVLAGLLALQTIGELTLKDVLIFIHNIYSDCLKRKERGHQTYDFSSL